MPEEINDELSDDDQAPVSSSVETTAPPEISPTPELSPTTQVLDSEEAIARDLTRLATANGNGASRGTDFDGRLAPLLKADAAIDPEVLLEYLSRNCLLEVLSKCAGIMIALLAGDTEAALGEKQRMSQLLLRLVLLCPPFLSDDDLTAYEAICDAENGLFFGFYKVVAAAANATLSHPDTTFKDRCATTYRSLRILARRMKETQLSTSDQWAVLEAINVTKDSCPHGDVFQQDSKDALLALAAANPTAHNNIVLWNACKAARKGDMKALAAAQPDGLGGVSFAPSSPRRRGVSSEPSRFSLFRSSTAAPTPDKPPPETLPTIAGAETAEVKPDPEPAPSRFLFFRSSTAAPTPDKPPPETLPTIADAETAEVKPEPEPAPSRFSFFRLSSSVATPVKAQPAHLPPIADAETEESEPEVRGSSEDNSHPNVSPPTSPEKSLVTSAQTANATDSADNRTASDESASSSAATNPTVKSPTLLSSLGFATTKASSIETALSGGAHVKNSSSNNTSNGSSSSSSNSRSSSGASGSPGAGSRSPKKPSTGEAEVLREYVSTLAAENKELKDALTAHILQMRAVQTDCTKKALEVRELQTKLEVVELEAQVGLEEVEQCKRQMLAMSSELNRFKTPAKGSPAAGKKKAGGGKGKKVARPSSAPRLRPVAPKTGPTATTGTAKALTLNRPEMSSNRPQRPRSASPTFNRLSTGARGKNGNSGNSAAATLLPYLLPTRPLSGGSKRPTKPATPKPSSASTRPSSARPKRAAEA